MRRLSPDKSGSYVGCYGFAAWQVLVKKCEELSHKRLILYVADFAELLLQREFVQRLEWQIHE